MALRTRPVERRTRYEGGRVSIRISPCGYCGLRVVEPRQFCNWVCSTLFILNGGRRP